MTLQIMLLGLSHGDRLPAFDSLASETWPECVHLCLQAAEWATTPRYRSIVTLLLYIPQAFLRLSMTCFQHLPAFMAAVTRLAISLEWHKLGSDASIMPKPADDPGLPFGNCGIRRQFGLVAWNNILFGSCVLGFDFADRAASSWRRLSAMISRCSLCVIRGRDRADVAAQPRRVRYTVPVQCRASLNSDLLDALERLAAARYLDYDLL